MSRNNTSNSIVNKIKNFLGIGIVYPEQKLTRYNESFSGNNILEGGIRRIEGKIIPSEYISYILYNASKVFDIIPILLSGGEGGGSAGRMGGGPTLTRILNSLHQACDIWARTDIQRHCGSHPPAWGNNDT